MKSESYQGEWVLVPELSFYENGTPPTSAVYRISVHEGRVSISMDWTVAGETQSVAFEGPLDGQAHIISAPVGASALYRHIDNQTLESRVTLENEEIAFSRRQVSDDGQLMSVLQINQDSEGNKVRIHQVYRRNE